MHMASSSHLSPEVQDDEYVNEKGSEEIGSHPVASIKDQIEQKLAVGSVFQELEDVYLIYCEFARLVRFSVRKGGQHYFVNSSEPQDKVYTCSCQGIPDNKRSVGRIPKFKKQMHRSDCKARLRVIREIIGGPWAVADFFNVHNHELVPLEQAYMLRTARNLSSSKKCVLETLMSSGIPVSSVYRFMEKEAGGRENVGFLIADAYRHVGGLKRKTKIPDGDATALFQYFLDRGNKEPFFYWKHQADDEGRLMNFFFRDTRSVVDYEIFGDVLSVDTTHKTNKYELSCAPFVGINHHRCNVMFGIGFLSDETTESFDWLFSTFLESMEGNEPEVIFFDQSRALMNGVDHVFKHASHRLCQWHINRNATSHFGSLNGDLHFKAMWHHCMNWCETEEQFQYTWDVMIGHYNLQEHEWFKSMYELRKRWSSAFTNQKFTAGLHATSQSEVTNKVLKDLCSTSSLLYEFVVQYERIQTDWRTRESEEDMLCLGMPGQLIPGNSLLTHIAQIYTRTLYKSHEYEASHTINVSVLNPTSFVDSRAEFILSSSSALGGRKVFYMLDVIRLPESLIMRRWMRNVKTRFEGFRELRIDKGENHLAPTLKCVPQNKKEKTNDGPGKRTVPDTYRRLDFDDHRLKRDSSQFCPYTPSPHKQNGYKADGAPTAGIDIHHIGT